MFIVNLNYVRSIMQSFVIRTSALNAWYEADDCLESNLIDLNKKDLLYNASLVVTPNSYKEVFLYPVFPLFKNLFPSSEELNLWTPGNSSVTANTIDAPDGTFTADSLIENTVASTTHGITRSGTIVNGNDSVTFSCYVKAAGRDYMVLQMQEVAAGAGGAVYYTCLFNLISGEYLPITVIGNIPDSSTIEFVGNGWWRISITKRMSISGPIAARINLANVFAGGGSYTYTGDGVSGAYIWGAQIEYGSTPSPYQKTYIAASTPTFTRSSIATRLNSLGVVEAVPSQNLLPQSETFNTTWTTAGGFVTVSTNTNLSPNGTTTADSIIETAVVGTHQLSTPVTVNLIAGQTYNFSVYVNRNSTRNISISLGATMLYANFIASTGVVGSNGADGINFSFVSYSSTIINSDWIRVSVTGTALIDFSTYARLTLDNSPTATGNETPSYLGDITKSIIVWGAQITQTSTAQQYFPTTTRFNVPRPNYVLGETCPSLLIESAVTNLYFPSSTFAGQTNTVSATTNANNYTVSFYGTGTITFSGAYTGTLVGTGVNNRVSVSFLATTISLISTVTGQVLNAQLENQSIATSYIPTTTTAVTKSPDVLTLGNLVNNNLFNSTTGATFFIECSPNFNATGLVTGDAQINVVSFLAGATQQFRVRYSGIFYPEDRINFVSMFDPTLQSTPFQIKKTVITILGNNVKMWQDGVAIQTSTSSGIYTYTFTPISLSQITSITIGAQRNQVNVKKIALYNQVLTDAQCLALSTL
jgi:hypothetical protein